MIFLSFVGTLSIFVLFPFITELLIIWIFSNLPMFECVLAKFFLPMNVGQNLNDLVYQCMLDLRLHLTVNLFKNT